MKINYGKKFFYQNFSRGNFPENEEKFDKWNRLKISIEWLEKFTVQWNSLNNFRDHDIHRNIPNLWFGLTFMIHVLCMDFFSSFLKHVHTFDFLCRQESFVREMWEFEEINKKFHNSKFGYTPKSRNSKSHMSQNPANS